MTMPPRNRRTVLLAFVSSCLLLLLHKLDMRTGDQESRIGGQWTERKTGKPDVRILSRPIDFPSIGPDRCIRAEPRHLGVAPVFCIKRDEEDAMISRNLLYTGEWEPQIVDSVLRAVQAYNTSVFIDLGSNLGVFSLSVAALHRRLGQQDRPRVSVVAVDGAAGNLAYIRRSLEVEVEENTKNLVMEGEDKRKSLAVEESHLNEMVKDSWKKLVVQDNKGMVTLVHNAVSDKEGLLYPAFLRDDPAANPGSIRFLPKAEAQLQGGALGPATSAVTLPQILAATVPHGATLIMKMDIQGQECRVLSTPGLFQAGHNIPYIFMEWMELFLEPSNCPHLEDFLDMLEQQGYTARWPDSLTMMPRHCLSFPWSDVLWAHRDAVPLWDEDTVMECVGETEGVPHRQVGKGRGKENGLRVTGVNVLAAP